MAWDVTSLEKESLLKGYNYHCFPDCPFFPKITDSDGTVPYVLTKDGIKVRATKIFFRCVYDDHIIQDWNKNTCPLKRGE